ncbi:hypothetical protein B0H10DRAFT_1943310 [Mycena sp. CBHHK59/15]|nr:hypothetical protein B0H10DRAFT_1943310 [Mycena sp. CBHHK59/15]
MLELSAYAFSQSFGMARPWIERRQQAPGLGDTTQGIPPITNLHRLDPALNHVKFIIPQEFAFITLNLIIRRLPHKVTGNSKRVMPAWFDTMAYIGLETDIEFETPVA